MIIGLPKEIKNSESRVAMTPAGVAELVRAGHQVLVENNAGVASGFADDAYTAAGGTLIADAKRVFAEAEMIVKVKEPIEQEYELIREDQVVFTFFHFASSQPLTEAMYRSGAICLTYETVELPDRSLPLLVPMSEIAGKMAAQAGAKHLESPQGGRGILLGGVPGVLPAKVLVLGGGVVGVNAARVAAGMGADVTILDVSLPKLRELDGIMPSNVNTLYSNRHNIERCLQNHDLVIGAVLIPGAKAPHLVTRDMLPLMRPGSVIVDVAVDQGGCIETARPTTHLEPTFVVDNVVHYCVANMPGAVPYTSTLALTNATLPYVMQLANKGWRRACVENTALKMGLNIVGGKVCYNAVAEAFGLPFTHVDECLA